MAKIRCTDAHIAYAKMALECQDACNGLAVINSMSRHLSAIKEGTQMQCQHPATILCLDKLSSLAGIFHTGDYLSKALNACNKLADPHLTDAEIEWDLG